MSDLSSNQSDDKNRGAYLKYKVERTDGSSGPGRKHENCFYFVLDCDHDPHAKAALLAYAESCKSDYPVLARDVIAMTEWGAFGSGEDTKVQDGLKLQRASDEPRTPPKLERYDLRNTSMGYEAHYEMVRDDEYGDWVRYADVAALPPREDLIELLKEAYDQIDSVSRDRDLDLERKLLKERIGAAIEKHEGTAVKKQSEHPCKCDRCTYCMYCGVKGGCECPGPPSTKGVAP